MQDIDIEFQHLLVEIRCQRWAMVERFLFSYFCFKNGYLSKSGKPDWQQARDYCPRSTAVTSAKTAHLEPLVPLDTVVGELKRLAKQPNVNEAMFKTVLDTLLDFALISKDEKQQLSDIGLGNQMPKDWYHAQEKSPLARFATARIHL